jgi:hypothetical protein
MAAGMRPDVGEDRSVKLTEERDGRLPSTQSSALNRGHYLVKIPREGLFLGDRVDRRRIAH